MALSSEKALAADADVSGNPASASAVVSGQARFEVLSPTLIRTEYSGERQFFDASTFNVIGRDDFTPTEFTTSEADGWLAIDTGAATLRYRTGSGPFTQDNLQVSLASGEQQVTARPWASVIVECAAGGLCEAEDAESHGLGTAKNHPGYTGTGFLEEWAGIGNYVAVQTSVETSGPFEVALRYANARGGDGKLTTRTLGVSIDNQPAVQVQLAPTQNWDTWGVARVPVTLTPGHHTIRIERGQADSGRLNLDSFALVQAGASYPTTTAVPTPQACGMGQVCEAEKSEMSGGAKLAKDHTGNSGSGFVGGLEKVGAQVRLHVSAIPQAGTYDLQVRYSNGRAGSDPLRTRTMSVTTSTSEGSLDLPATANWDTWSTEVASVELGEGEDEIVLGCPAADSCKVNLDTLAVVEPGTGILSPHVALGGYRRGLDDINGRTATYPGLLYRDGWTLLDDTTSDVFDESEGTLDTGDGHGPGDYQDGYVFAFGQDYARALQDLATLTGPSMLLPRWAYGVWYSEYFDRTAQEFKDIVQRARAENVPMDVLGIDTDFKSPDKWNGWEYDTTRFPDASEFSQWMRDKGVRTFVNNHPSIHPDDPQFQKTQETAKGGLGGGGTRFTFDFSDPDQLQAYVDLHQEIGSQGADFWWFDWCCDGSKYSRSGVTADAWMGYQYAKINGQMMEKGQPARGFGFTRTYGGLDQGGYRNPTTVPTGPWADKRYSLHFTGDTISSWESLAMQVGYTPGESAATGLVPVSHDIGGHTGGTRLPGAEEGSTQLAGDLYARWVQLGTFQPIDRLHSNHSDRLPWQYPGAAGESAKDFLNLRERLVPYTYTLAAQAEATGMPIARALYLQYPDQAQAYERADTEYLYGPDLLVAPITGAGETVTREVWFPEGSTWTDWFTGETHQGGTTAQVSAGLDTMPVFVRSGGMVLTRTSDVPNDSSSPLSEVTLRVAEGQEGSMTLFEDDGLSTDRSQSARTTVSYSTDEAAGVRSLVVQPAQGTFEGMVESRTWTLEFTNSEEPPAVMVDGAVVDPASWAFDPGSRTTTVQVPARPVTQGLTVELGPEPVTPLPVVVTPAEVTFEDKDGTAHDTFLVPTTEGVDYLVEGQVIEAGLHPGLGSVTVDARARDGFVLAEGATTQWHHEFSSASPGNPDPTDPDPSDPVPSDPGTAGVPGTGGGDSGGGGAGGLADTGTTSGVLALMVVTLAACGVAALSCGARARTRARR